jgi:hypothetical protein
MTHAKKRFATLFFSLASSAFLLCLLCAAPASAQALQTISPPEGGQIVYGQVAGQTTEAGAMGAVLRSVHQNVGEKPQVGKLFQVHGTESVAVFFNATRRNGAGGQVGGIVIVTKVSSDHVEAALVTDEATRFHRNLPQYMKTLMAAWHPFKDAAQAQNSGAQSGGPSAPVAALHQVALPDRSASVSLPDGWQIAPRISGGGTIVASGPNGEVAFLGVTFGASDTNNPMVQQTMRALQAGGLRGTVYAQAAYIPYGADMQKTFVYLFNKSRASGNMPTADWTFSSFTPVQGGGPNHCAHLTGTVDFKDQRGVRELNGLFCVAPPNRAGGYLTEAYVTTIPQALAAKERATAGAILQSFNVDQGVVNAEAARIAAPAIAQIHAIGAAAAAQAHAAHQAEDIQNSSVYAHWDSMDRRSQEFENYQLGYSVVSDTGNNAHGTLYNEDAEALVKSNPDRFEYVSAPNYWKGIDY